MFYVTDEEVVFHKLDFRINMFNIFCRPEYVFYIFSAQVNMCFTYYTRHVFHIYIFQKILVYIFRIIYA